MENKHLLNKSNITFNFVMLAESRAKIWPVLVVFSLTVKAAPHECVIRTS